MRTIAYEKNTNVPIVIDPASLSDGINESQGKYNWKYQPVLNSQIADPIMQDKHSKKSNSTICKMKTNISFLILNEIFCLYYASYSDDEKIEQPIDGRALKFWLSRILHKFRIPPGENNHTITPFSVSQNASS